MGPDLKDTFANEARKLVRKSISSPSGMMLTFKRAHEGLDPAVSSEPAVTFNGASRRRILKGQADYGSDDEHNLFRALRQRPWISYHECETSSEEESDSEQMNNVARSTAVPLGVVRGCANCEGCQKVFARWRPEAGCRPLLEEAPVFFPLEEEFRDTLKYIASISAEAEQYGICRIVPPHSWRPPCPLKDSEKRQTAKFPTRVQQVDKLQVREAQAKKCSWTRKRRRGRPRKDGIIGGRSFLFEESPKDAACERLEEEDKFGFEPGPKFTLEGFEKYAHQFKEEYFGIRDGIRDEICSDPKMKGEPSVESIEGEYWRIVEHATEQIEILYGADIETREFGSGFPKCKPETEPTAYESSGWNLNNIARLSGSVLSFEESEISGVVVPWLYVGMCFSSFCWHVEDHHFYSLNYMHFGSPKVWYGVPGSAAHKLEDSMRKHLPDLFEEQPDLLQKLVTQLSPSVLKAAGVPVYRAVQKAGEFIVTFPRAYHAGFSCGFNCAEAVNVAPLDWLPHGQSAVELYRGLRRKSSVSHDKLLIGAADLAVKTLLQFSGVKADVNTDMHVSPWKGLVDQDEVLQKALENRVDLERTRRARIENMVYARRMDRCFDAVHERECAICRYDLHLSAVGCACVPEHYTCLEHAHQLCTCGQTRKFALYRYELSELDSLVTALKGQLDAASRWLNLEGLRIKCSAFSGTKCFTQDESNTSLSGIKKRSEYSRTGFHSIYKKHCITPQSPMSFSVLPTEKDRQISGFTREPAQNVQDDEANRSKKILFEQDYSELLNCEQNAEGFRNGEAEATARQEKISLPVVHDHSKSEDSQCGGQQNSQPLLHPVSGEVLGIKRNENLIVLSDNEDDGAGCAFSNGVCAMKFASGTGGNCHEMENCPCLKDVQTFPLFRHDTNTALEGGVMQPMRASGRDGFLASTPVGGAELRVKSQHSPNKEAMCFYPYTSTGSGGYDLNKRVEHGGIFNRHFRPPLPHMLKSFLGKDCSQQMPPVSHATSMEKDKECDCNRSIDVSEHTLAYAVGKGQGNSGCSFHGLPSLDRTEEMGYKVDLINIGRLVPHKSWYNKEAIFPAGFRSRVLFPSILDPFQSRLYVSEVLDSGCTEPLFKVAMEDHPNEAFIDPSIDRCWQMVQERINMIIQSRHDLGNMRLSMLRPPKDLQGIELFGFTSPHIIKAMESLDRRHQCIEYWAGRLSAVELLKNQHQIPISGLNATECKERSNDVGGRCEASNFEASFGHACVDRSPLTSSRSEELKECRLREKGSEFGIPQTNKKLYSALRGLFMRATPSELWALHRLFNSEWGGLEWREGFKALKDELEPLCY